MKKIMIYFLLLAMPAASFSQSGHNSVPPVKIDYLKKSKGQKTAAWILLGGGLGLTIAGAATGAYEVVSDFVNAFETGERQTNTGAVIIIAGSAAMLGSIPLFISAAKNKGRSMAATAGLKMEKMQMIQQKSFVQNSYPAVSLKLRF